MESYNDQRGRSFLEIIESISAIAQSGLTFAGDKYDIERYERLRTIAAELMARFFDIPIDAALRWLTLDEGYPTPKLDVRAVVLRGEHVLLVREEADGKWALPGGWADINSSPAESVVREVREETGLNVEASRLLALYDKQKRDYPPQLPHAYKAFFHCREIGGSLVQGTQETLAARFFPCYALPPLSRGRITEIQLERVVSLALEPSAQTEFD